MSRGASRTSWWHWLVPNRFVRAPRSEDDVGRDTGVARSRAHGGPTALGDVADAGTTTGTADNQLFVGRVAGDDLGYAEETGAEARRTTESEPHRSSHPEDGAADA